MVACSSGVEPSSQVNAILAPLKLPSSEASSGAPATRYINKPTCRNSPRGREKTRGEELVAIRAVDFEEVWSETARFGNVGLKEVQEATDETCVVADFGARDSDLICVFSRTVGGCRGTGC
jgi:hypothetical protein